jgi:lipoic acid synthetase
MNDSELCNETKKVRKPVWLKVRLPSCDSFGNVKNILKQYCLNTVCEEASCPNMGECWGKGTATFMLMGNICTRNCHFCLVKSGNPNGILDHSEPKKIASAVKDLKLSYVVLTSVDRDDLSDCGSEHFAHTINKIKKINQDVIIEALIPDFKGNINFLKKIVEAKPNVIGHNIETVKSLTYKVRDIRSTYEQSIKVLKNVKILDSKIFTKSSIMLGLGEDSNEVIMAMKDLINAKVDFLTIGQYLQPSNRNLKVKEYIDPEKFELFEKKGREMGFLHVLSSPLARSSYMSSELLIEYMRKNKIL